jgi:peptide-methionine (R)-S-oxide reductase
VCSECGYGLFSSRAKYAHDTPWPAFAETMHPDSVHREPEHEPQESSQCTALKVN